MKAWIALLAICMMTAAGCGKDEATPGLTIKGYSIMPTAAATLMSAMPSLPSGGVRTGCDGTSSKCCTIGTGCKPTLMQLKLYKAWVSKNADCSEGELVADNGANPEAADFAQNPTVIQGTPSAGTYQCVVLKMDDTMTFKVNQLSVDTIGGACGSTTTPYTFDVYRAGENTWVDYETGALVNGAGEKDAPSAQPVYIYASTNTAAITKGSTNQRITLASPLVVEEGKAVTAAFVIDFSDQINDDNGDTAGGHCWMAEPALGFMKL